MGRLPASRRVPSRRDDKGFTLVEMGVAVLIMTIFMALVIAGLIHVLNPTVQTEAIRDSSGQLNIAFLEMDSEVRYASEIWSPYPGKNSGGVADGNWDVLFQSTFNGATEPTCTELQYDPTSGDLSQASWTEGATSQPAFEVIAQGLTGTSDPFTEVNATNSNFMEQELEVTLTAVSGSGNGVEKTTSQVTFTALNSSSSAYSDPTSTTSVSQPNPTGACWASWTQS
jgi:prepilin-type N-terminal cleavage/methylation domain-containing protein